MIIFFRIFYYQITESALTSQRQVQKHFDELRKAINQALDERQEQLQSQVAEIEQTASEPLQECEEVIQVGITNAAVVLDEGIYILTKEINQILR